MELASGVAGLIGLADLIIKYSALIGAWKDAPEALVRIKDSLGTLHPIAERLGDIQRDMHTQDLLLANGLNLVAFTKNLKALDDLANDLLEPDGITVKTWKRVKWTVSKSDYAAELGKRLDTHIGVFTLVMSLVAQYVIESQLYMHLNA